MKKVKNSDFIRVSNGDNEVTYKLKTAATKNIFPKKLKAKTNNEEVTLILFDESLINKLQESLKKVIEIQKNENLENKTNPLKRISKFILQ